MFLSALDTFAEELSDLSLERSGRFDPSSRWSLVYQEYALRVYVSSEWETSFKPEKQKLLQLQLNRQPLENDRFQLEVAYSKSVTGTQQYSGSMICRADAWSSLLSWNYEYRSFRQGWSPFDVSHKQSGVREDGNVIIRAETFPPGRKKYPDIPRLTGTYALIDALMRGCDVPGSFSFLEDFTLIHPEMKLVRSDQAREGAGHGMKRYVLYGGTNLPAGFWVDEDQLVRYICVGPHHLLALASVKGGIS